MHDARIELTSACVVVESSLSVNNREQSRVYWITFVWWIISMWRRSAKRIIAMIVASWIMSTIVSIPTLFGLQDPSGDSVNGFQTVNCSREDSCLLSTSNDEDRPMFDKREEVGFSNNKESYNSISSADAGLMFANKDANETVLSEFDDMVLNCIISQNLGYTVFSTVCAFYLPLTFIVAIYINVYRAARSRIRRRQFSRRRDNDRPGTQPDASTFDPDIDTSQAPGVVWQALRSRLNAISLGLPASAAAPSLPASRTSSVDDGSLRRTGSTSTQAADRKVSSTQQQQQLLQPPSSRQYLSVGNGQRLSESSSAPSSTSSSRGGSWVYFTR